MMQQIDLNNVINKYCLQVEQLAPYVYEVTGQKEPICLNNLKSDLQNCILLTSDISKRKSGEGFQRYGMVKLIALEKSPVIREMAENFKKSGIRTVYEPYSIEMFAPSVHTVYVSEE